MTFEFRQVPISINSFICSSLVRFDIFEFRLVPISINSFIYSSFVGLDIFIISNEHFDCDRLTYRCMVKGCINLVIV